MVTFMAFVRRQADGSCTVEFPDLPGCVAVAAHPEHAGALAGDELARYLAALTQFGEPIPKPSSNAQLAHDPRRGNAELVAFGIDPRLLGLAHALTYHTL
ncbi:type II toxin-antitoxin system HicB family antitoxin [Ideonella oryzae]|uniref:Type II toxin-antitoxin system HicB family antitoxin n=1 Tax=Ideonella oryzae TaxID=2937441 RepID=A0ABT1BG81_9BURK|nr:type II toxin-antitoxin system HicB family antitoxin [Ideonella oryzae]MCO5975215.1 type II toxin-antitoxin system HicB family antitoxin [Ideonella oryzae]